MKKSVLCIVLPLCLILFCSCQDMTIDHKLLLQGQEYKLWYIVNKEKDSLEWVDLDFQKLASFWTTWEYDVEPEDYQYDVECKYVTYFKFVDKGRLETMVKFKKKLKAPEFLYIDSDGYACVLTLDRNVGDFVEKQDSEITGYWKMKNDSVIMLNNSLYQLSQTSNTIQLSNLQTGNSFEIADANFPSTLTDSVFPSYIDGHLEAWTNENEIEHYNKWGFGIKQSPVLQGRDYKLWRTEKNYGFDQEIVFERDSEYTVSLLCNNYYCQFIYFNKYGRKQELRLTINEYENRSYSNIVVFKPSLTADDYRWQMREYYVYDSTKSYGWYPAGNDAVYNGYMNLFKISCINKDTLCIYNSETNKEEIRYTAVNLPPKSKWEKFKKR